MKTKTFFYPAVIRVFLIVLIGVSLVFSLYCDAREQKKVRLGKLRDQLPFIELFKLESGDTAVQRALLQKFLLYFLSYLENEPARPEAHAMAGFCYFHLGEIDKAVKEYQKALEFKPGIFWFHYNLAVIYHRQGQDEAAAREFRQALMTKPADNFEFLRNSKIFIYMIYKIGVMDLSLGERLRDGYSASAFFVSQYLAKSGDLRGAEDFRQRISAAGIELPRAVAEPLLKIF